MPLVFQRFFTPAVAEIVERRAEVEGGRGRVGIERRGKFRFVRAELPGEVQKLIESEVSADALQQHRRQLQREQRIAFAEFFPQLTGVAVFEQADGFRQAEETPLVADEFQAEAVDRAEERAAQIGQQSLTAMRAFAEVLEHEVARPDAQLLRREFAVGHDDQPREHARTFVASQREVGDAADNRRGFADARPRRHAEIFVERTGKRFARFGVEQWLCG